METDISSEHTHGSGNWSSASLSMENLGNAMDKIPLNMRKHVLQEYVGGELHDELGSFMDNIEDMGKADAVTALAVIISRLTCYLKPQTDKNTTLNIINDTST